MTMAITAKAKQLKAEGKDVIGFGAGEPDFDTPDHIKQAAITALNNGVTKYAPAPGSNELRDAIVAKFARDNDLTYTRDQVIVNIGAKHTVFAALMVVVDRDDEVIIPAPFWVSYPEITPKTRALILTSPSNPTGQVYSADELRALAEIAVEAGLVILSDEIYEKLLYDGATHQSVAALSDDIYNHTITINGMSKAFSMTGWRLGYAAGPQPIIKAMSSMQSHSTSNPVSFAMVGGVEALNAGYDFLPTFLEAFDRRRTHLVDALNAVDGITCAKPQGAFYVFPDASGLLGRSTPEGKTIATTMDLADYLLESVGVGVVPGEAFGAPGCMRLSYATSDANVEEGARRIAQAADKLQ
jgi:aspartate aminotransferase